MVRTRTGTKLLGAALLACGGAASAWAAGPNPAQILQFRPRQAGVDYSVPKANEQSTCRVELVKGAGKGSGWLLRDPANQPLRRFFDSTGDNKIDVWSYYKDGVEVYREIDTDNNGKPDQYRWLNAGGSKWGVDADEDGKIDTWKVISAEEVGQELLQALVARDAARLQTLLLTEQDIQALGLTGTDLERVREGRKQAATLFQQAVAKATAFNEKTNWIHLEAGKPQCLPQDQTGARYDYVRHANATVLCETNGANEWVQTGEMIQVGQAWRLVGGPTIGVAAPAGPTGGTPVMDKALQALLEQMKDLDARAPKARGTGPDADAVRYDLERADLIEKIVAKVDPRERDPWIRQLADCLSGAAQASPAGERMAMDRLQRLVQQLTTAVPGSNLAAYTVFRQMTAEYTLRLGEKNPDFGKIQEQWIERLTAFVKAYPRSGETADAYMQLGMVSEFTGKEAEAKKWYQSLAANFPDSPLAARARGAVERMELEGKEFQLTGPLLQVPTQQLDIHQMRGKAVIVYYWASWNGQCAGDFAKLKSLLDTHAAKGLDLVTVNLDTNLDEAKEFLKTNAAPGVHLHQPGGLDSPLATRYGILGLPTLFLVDKDGKVLSRSAQITTLDEELKKHLK